jgi:hypothetical protein
MKLSLRLSIDQLILALRKHMAGRHLPAQQNKEAE